MGASVPAPISIPTSRPQAVSSPRPPKNAFNESERRSSNLERTLLDFDNSVEARVRKAQRVGGTLLEFNPDRPAIPKPPTTRA